jgi:hypothetical protein
MLFSTTQRPFRRVLMLILQKLYRAGYRRLPTAISTTAPPMPPGRIPRKPRGNGPTPETITAFDQTIDRIAKES